MLKTVKKMKKRPYKVLGENVSRMRKAQGWSDQLSFAHAAGIGVTAIKKIESGVGEGDFDTRMAIANTLNVGLDVLYRGLGKSRDISAEEELLLSFFRDSDEEFRTHMIAVFRTHAIQHNKLSAASEAAKSGP